MKIGEVIIIGAGPAGLSAGLQLKRYGIVPLILERAEIGGLLRNANLVENYPGFPGGIPGPRLVGLIEEQVRKISLAVTFEAALTAVHEDGLFCVQTPTQKYYSRVLVIASGTKPRTFKDLAVPCELREKIFYEVYPLLSLVGSRIAIVGAGDAAFDYALNLGRNNDVIILIRGTEINCLPLLRERASASSRITCFLETRISRLAGAPGDRIFLECVNPSGVVKIVVDYLIGAVGRDAQLDFLSESLRAKAQQLADQDVLHLVGDVKNGVYRQTSIAVGDGIMAAMKIHQYLMGS